MILKKAFQLTLFLFFLASGQKYAQNNLSDDLNQETKKSIQEKPDKEELKKDKNSTAIWHEFELDAYYTSLGLYLGIWGEEPENLGKKKEVDVYWHLITTSYFPSFLVLEASVYPMPVAGVGLKKYATKFYEKGRLSPNFNLIEAVTSGYQEPYAASLFIGNIVVFQEEGEEKETGNQAFMGWVFSTGDYHIKDNVLIKDLWFEVEGKIKGDRNLPDQKLSWSFKIGARFHQNEDIEDIAFVGIRRSRVDLEGSLLSFFYNGGIEYTFDFDFRKWIPIRHYLLIEKKFPVYKKIAVSLDVGFIWEAKEKYEGFLDTLDKDNWKVFIRPNMSF
ncbi:MAG: hypothetical protein OEZ13_06080 [Spirochaetia bacterium]|nr:hypothetical protein [Spirochaetia bacterium]